MDGPTFMAYVEQVLAPTLNKGDIVFMDNLRTHKIVGVREAIEAVGASVRYLPAYAMQWMAALCTPDSAHSHKILNKRRFVAQP
jgi:hypothetical protein